MAPFCDTGAQFPTSVSDSLLAIVLTGLSHLGVRRTNYTCRAVVHTHPTTLTAEYRGDTRGRLVCSTKPPRSLSTQNGISRMGRGSAFGKAFTCRERGPKWASDSGERITTPSREFCATFDEWRDAGFSTGVLRKRSIPSTEWVNRTQKSCTRRGPLFECTRTVGW